MKFCDQGSGIDTLHPKCFAAGVGRPKSFQHLAATMGDAPTAAYGAVQ